MQVPREVLRGGSTSGAPSALPLFLSPRGGWGYPVSLRGGSTSGAPPSALPPWVGLPGPHPGFLSFHDERNQRRAGAVPLAPQCVVAALFTLAYASRRATLYHQPRPICHFEMGGRIGLFSPGGIAEGTPSGFRPWRGRWTNWRLAGVVITICSHRYDTFTVTNDQTLSPYLYYYHYLFYIKRVSFVTVSQQMAYLCGLLVILGVIPA